jgi:AcrR family transcriptional regulator
MPTNPVKQPAGPRAKRYHSPKREEAALTTRRAIRAAALELFLRDGYARTPMTAIAKQAGVAEKTVYLAFESKAALLGEIIRVTLRGDDTTEKVDQRDDWQSMLTAPGDEMLARLATVTASLMKRTAHVLALGEAAAASDPDLAKQRAYGHAAARADSRAVAEALAAGGGLAPGLRVDHAADVIFAVATDESLYLRLVEECGWTATQYADVLRALLEGALSPEGRGRTGS